MATMIIRYGDKEQYTVEMRRVNGELQRRYPGSHPPYQPATDWARVGTDYGDPNHVAIIGAINEILRQYNNEPQEG